MKLSKSALEEKLGTATRFKMHGRSYLLAHSSNFQPTSPDAMELFQIFDNDDEEVIVNGRKLLFYRGQCHGPERIRGFFHRGVNVLLERNGSLYIPKRADDKDLYPSCHEFSVGEHAKVGESYEAAAARGVKEELGVQIAKTGLRLIRQMPVVDEQQEEQVKYFLLRFKGGRIKPSSEVESGSWMSVKEIKKNITSLNFRADHFPVFREFIGSGYVK